MIKQRSGLLKLNVYDNMVLNKALIRAASARTPEKSSPLSNGRYTPYRTGRLPNARTTSSPTSGRPPGPPGVPHDDPTPHAKRLHVAFPGSQTNISTISDDVFDHTRITAPEVAHASHLDENGNLVVAGRAIPKARLTSLNPDVFKILLPERPSVNYPFDEYRSAQPLTPWPTIAPDAGVKAPERPRSRRGCLHALCTATIVVILAASLACAVASAWYLAVTYGSRSTGSAGKADSLFSPSTYDILEGKAILPNEEFSVVAGDHQGAPLEFARHLEETLDVLGRHCALAKFYGFSRLTHVSNDNGRVGADFQLYVNNVISDNEAQQPDDVAQITPLALLEAMRTAIELTETRMKIDAPSLRLTFEDVPTEGI